MPPEKAPHFCAMRAKAAEPQTNHEKHPDKPLKCRVFYKASDQQSSKGSRSWTVEGGWGPEEVRDGRTGSHRSGVLWGLDWVVDQKKDRVGEPVKSSETLCFSNSYAPMLIS